MQFLNVHCGPLNSYLSQVCYVGRNAATASHAICPNETNFVDCTLALEEWSTSRCEDAKLYSHRQLIYGRLGAWHRVLVAPASLEQSFLFFFVNIPSVLWVSCMASGRTIISLKIPTRYV